ncbi:putative methyltransferase-domain-containing protein [Syncephalis fuscata]|nr:putative methyltransferase-domain-containing protein [Syncephalis fuscata]
MPPHRKRLTKRRPITLSASHTALNRSGSNGANNEASIYTKPNNQLIRRYHTLNKELAQCEATNNTIRACEIRDELKTLGGLDAYQSASVKGASFIRGGDTSRWLIKQLTSLDVRSKISTDKLRLLDVGALAANNYYRESAWIEVDAVDLNPREKGIRQGDFITMSPPEQLNDRYDIICLSLVVNFVGDIKARGTMLRRVIEFLRPNGAGYLFLVLPLPCINNSRYLDHDLLIDIMKTIGMDQLVAHHFSSRLAYYLFQRDTTSACSLASANTSKKFTKKEIRPGGKRNNFCIVLD